MKRYTVLGRPTWLAWLRQYYLRLPCWIGIHISIDYYEPETTGISCQGCGMFIRIKQ